MPSLRFKVDAEEVFLIVEGRSFPLPSGLEPGAAVLLTCLVSFPMEAQTSKSISDLNGIHVKKDTVKRWIRSAQRFLERAREADLPAEAREHLSAFVLKPGGGPGRDSSAMYAPTSTVDPPPPSTPEDGLWLRDTKIWLRYVPGGTYIRGRSATSHTDERPAHAVRLSPFLLAEWPVTNAQYQTFLDELRHALSSTEERERGRAEALLTRVHAMWVEGARWARDDRATPDALHWGAPDAVILPEVLLHRLTHNRWETPTFRDPGNNARTAALERAAKAPDAPVVGVDWLCVHAWLHWHHLELPPESVWEYAALGNGAPGTIGAKPGRKPQIVRPVGSHHPGDSSTLGFRAMIGNTWEWCADWYDLYPQDEGAPPVWDPHGPTEPPTRSGRRGLPYRVLRGGSWEAGDSGVAERTRGGNFIQWRAIWDSFRPYSNLSYAFLAWQFELPADLETQALGVRDALLEKLDPRTSPFLDTSGTRSRLPSFRKAVEEHTSARRERGRSSQVSLVSYAHRIEVHHVKGTWAHEVPGLPQLLAGVSAGTQAGPHGTFAWIDRLNGEGATVHHARLSFCAWSRVPGMDAWLLVESHADLDPGTFAHDHEVFGWLRRAGWDDRRWSPRGA